MLHRTCDAMRRLHGHGQQMQRVASLLEVSGYGFAVESARSIASQQAFGTFVTELRKLAAKVGALGEAIAGQAHAAQEESERLGRTMTASLAELGQLTARADATVRQTSVRAESVLHASWTALQEADRDTARIAAHASDAVYHLQFGDIVRQKLEHVVDAFGEAAPEHGDHVLSVQAGQLELVGEEIASARQQLDRAFGGLAEETRGLAETIGHFGRDSESEDAGKDPLAELRAAFTNIGQVHLRGRELCADARATSGRATETAGHLSGYLAEVEEINRQMHLQALNAIIKTALLGNDGRTLEILSMHVQRVFEESSGLVGETVGVIESLSTDANACGGAAAVPEDTAAAVQHNLDELARVRDEFHHAMRAAAEQSDRQSATLSQARVSLGFLSELGEEVAALRREVAAVRPSAPGRAAAPEGGVHPAVPASRYTIASEREVHRRVTQTAAAPGSSEDTPAVATPENDNIDLFLDPPPPNTAAPEEEDLGDNVDLF
jgi:methyl-accepting chemotaxis protein